MLKVTEDPRSDISSVYAFLITKPAPNAHGFVKQCDTWSVFNREYEWGKEREFIAALDAANPGKYSRYHIAWDNCN